MSSTLNRLQQWRENGAITTEQHGAISAIVRKDRFSVFLELNLLLYLGVLSLALGIGATVKKYFANLSDAAVLVTLTALFAGSLYYCFSRTKPFSVERVESPTFAFDYVLYFACLVMSIELGYIEYNFAILADSSDLYFWFSAAVFMVFAYRFDNRFVLSMALSSLAGAFGLRVTRHGLIDSTEQLRVAGLGYSALVVAIGVWLHRTGVKKHFLETFLHVAANVGLLALLSGTAGSANWPLYLLLLAAVAAVSIYLGTRYKRFAFVAYGVLYGYFGLTSIMLKDAHDPTAVLSYLVTTGTIVIVGLVILARKFGKAE